MTKYLLLATSLALASCATQKALPHYTDAEKQAQRESISWWKPAPPPANYLVPAADSADATKYEAMPDLLPFMKVPQKPLEKYEVEGAKRGFLARLFLPNKAKAPAALQDNHAPQLPSKCKNCTIVYGNAQVVGKKGQVLGDGASNTETGKKSGDIIKADSGASVNKVAGPGNVQTTRGNNNAPQLSAPVQEAPSWRAVLAKPAGLVGAGVIGLLVVGGAVYLIVLWRKKKAGETLV